MGGRKSRFPGGDQCVGLIGGELLRCQIRITNRHGSQFCYFRGQSNRNVEVFPESNRHEHAEVKRRLAVHKFRCVK